MRPTNVLNPTPQAINNVTNITNPNGTAEVNAGVSATQRQIEVSRDEDQRQQKNLGGPPVIDGQPNVAVPATNRQVEQISCAHCSCHSQLSKGAMGTSVPTVESRRLNLHTEYEDKSNGASRFFHGKRQNEGKSVRECQIIRILPEEDDDYMEIVRDSVSAQNRRDLKPMFVNNYFAGDNNWRTVPQNNSETIRHSDESRS